MMSNALSRATLFLAPGKIPDFALSISQIRTNRRRSVILSHRRFDQSTQTTPLRKTLLIVNTMSWRVNESSTGRHTTRTSPTHMTNGRRTEARPTVSLLLSWLILTFPAVLLAGHGVEDSIDTLTAAPVKR